MRRSAWVSAAYGSGSPATGTQAPARVVALARAMNSVTRRVLPTPVSPETTTTVGFPGGSAAERVGQLLQDALASDQLAGGAEVHLAILRPTSATVIAITGV